MTEEETLKIANFMGIGLRDFVDKYARLTKDRACLSLKELENGACIFLSDAGECAINEIKPGQCRDFPYGWNYPEWEKDCRSAVRYEKKKEENK